MNKINKQRYEAPQAEIIEIEYQGILCASAPDVSAGGGTTNMGINSGNGW
jgi:hypothetical protein